MIESPKSLTAVVHVKFHYKELKAVPVAQSEPEILNSILDRASEMPPEYRELLIKFTDYLGSLSGNSGDKEKEQNQAT